MNMPRLHTLDVEQLFLHAYGANHHFRVVAVFPPAPFSAAQDWTITDRGNGRFAIHLALDGVERYLTGEDQGGFHVFTAPQDPDFDRQTWRRDQGPVDGLISLGKSGRFLQADSDGDLFIEPDDGGLRGYNVELARLENLTGLSTWGPSSAFA
jgi:hypothetical protein